MSRRCDVGGVGLRRSSCRQIVEYSVEMSRAIRAPPRRMAALHGTKRGERLMAAPDMQAECDDVWNGVFTLFNLSIRTQFPSGG